MKNHQNPKRAFTLTELLVVLAVVAILAATLLPALAFSKLKVQKINCINNLKQIGLAFHLWEQSNNDRFPMAVSYTAGGALEYVSHSSGTPSPAITSANYDPGVAFLVMSNQLATPRVLACPADTIHNVATNFSWQNLLSVVTTPPRNGTAPPPIAPSAISYFVGGDATEADPQSIVSGDCNIGNLVATANSAPASWRFGQTSTGSPSTWSQSSAAVALSSTAWSGFNGAWAWTANDLHQKTGNLLIADGSVESTTIPGLHTFLQMGTNTVQYPVVNFIW